MNSWKMAAAGLTACEKTHTFPKYEGPMGTDPMDLAEPILIVKDVKKAPCPTELFCVCGKSETSNSASETTDHSKENNQKKELKEVASECTAKSKVKRFISDKNAEKMCGTSASDANMDEKQTKVQKVPRLVPKHKSADTSSVKDIRQGDHHKVKSQNEQQTHGSNTTDAEGMKIKQTKAADKDGMADGYKRVRLGIK